MPPTRKDIVWEFWGMDQDGTPCAFLSAYYRVALNVFIILGIEVRVGWRGEGKGMEIYEATQNLLTEPLLGDGFFTPRGWRSLQAHIPVTNEQDRPIVTSTNFVEDWDNMIAA